MTFSTRKFIFTAVLFSLLSLNTLEHGPVLLNWFLVAIIALFVGSWWGSLLFEETTSWRWKWIWGMVAFNALHIVLASALYILMDARPALLLTSLTLAAIPSLFHKKSTLLHEERILDELNHAHRVLFEELQEVRRFEQSSVLSSLFVLAPIAIDGYLITVLQNAATTEAILSPWQVVPASFFILFALATLLLFRYTLTKLTFTRLAAVMIHCLVFFGVASFVYKIGFGFDGFIHRAAEYTISEQAELYPKNPYYIGQYVFMVTRHHILEIAIPTLERWLLPLLMCILVPLALLWFYKERFKTPSIQPLLLLLLFPASLFITTTPQAFSLVLVFVAILLTRSKSNARSGARHLALLLSLASAAIHPLSGIPALLYIAYVYTSTLPRVPWASYALYTIVGILTLPLITFFQLHAQPDLSQLLLPFSTGFAYLMSLHPPDTTLIFQFIYSYKHLFLPILFVGVILVHLIRHRNNHNHAEHLPLLLTSAVLLVNALYFSIVEFPLVIGYEQQSYSLRLLFMTGMFISPFFFAGIVHLAKKVQTPRIVQLTVLALFLAATTSALYLSYPRVDRIERSKGFSTSIHDVQAVQTITEHSNKNAKSYVVLTNQAVSAAAAEQLRFSPSVTLEGQEQFVYPIPTGGPLYPYYLQMVYEQTFAKTAQTLKQKANVDSVYFVLNHYWTNAKDIAPIAATAAKEVLSIGDKVWIFIF